MVETGIFASLKRLFSTDVIIRNIGGSKLKVADTNQIQRSGELMTNSLYQRYSRIYTTSPTSLYGNQTSFNYQTLRPQLYSEYDAMDTDAIIASALDILSDESTLKNDMGEIIQIKSSDENIQKILHNLFYDILNVEFNLWMWIRNMAKYGDFFLKLEISEEYGVYNVIPFSAFNIERQEGFDKNNPTEVRFRLDKDGNTAGSYGYYNVPTNQDDNNSIFFNNYEIAHFRLLSDVNYLPYGRSYIEPARKLFKQYTLMEDAMLVHRIVRAPEKRIFYMNTAGIPPNEVENFMEKAITKMKRVPYQDPTTGEYNLKYNMQNLMEDFYIPVRNNDSSTKIDTLGGLEWDGIKDIEYLRDKLFAALKIPKAFLGYDADIQGKCIHPDTEIKLLDGSLKTVKEIAEEFNLNPETELYTYSFDFITNSVVPGKIIAAEKTRENAKLVRVWIDNGTSITTTPDHGFILENGVRIEAQDLKEGDSLQTILVGQGQIVGSNYVKTSELINNYFDSNFETEYLKALAKSESSEPVVNTGEYTNFKVVRIERLEEVIDTYNIEVYDKNNNHNYLTGNGIVIKNSTLASEDIRFSRTIERIQRIIISELYKIAFIHLYVQGFRKESLTNFTLEMTNPSIVYEQEKIALLKEKVGLASELMESHLFPSDWIYDNVFGVSEDNIDEYRDQVREDAKRLFRLSQIENEGNDPVETGEVYGTPHEIATSYGKGRVYDKPDGVPEGYNELGRPEEKVSRRNTGQDPFGLDRLGAKGMKDTKLDKNINPAFNGNSPLALNELDKFLKTKSTRKTLLYENKDKTTLLNEDTLEE